MPDIVKVLLRLPRDLHEELKGWAADEDRSLTNLIVHLLRVAVRDRRR